MRFLMLQLRFRLNSFHQCVHFSPELHIRRTRVGIFDFLGWVGMGRRWRGRRGVVIFDSCQRAAHDSGQAILRMTNVGQRLQGRRLR